MPDDFIEESSVLASALDASLWLAEDELFEELEAGEEQPAKRRAIAIRVEAALNVFLFIQKPSFYTLILQ